MKHKNDLPVNRNERDTNCNQHDTRVPNVNPPPHDAWRSEVGEWTGSADEGFAGIAICDDADHELVRIESTVEIRDLRSGEVEEYTLVAPAEANILENRISSLTPLGRAVYGRRVGEVVEYEAPAGTVRVRVEKVRCPCWTSEAERQCAASR